MLQSVRDFIASHHTCESGNESNPDTTKPLVLRLTQILSSSAVFLGSLSDFHFCFYKQESECKEFC